MKKIALFSLIILISVGGGDIAMADSCRQITNGAVICGSIPVGGSMESGKCKKDDGTFKDIGALCNPVNAPIDYGHCIKSNVAGQTSCAAEKCNGGYLLYTTNRRHEIDVVGTNGKVGSQGICTSRQALKNFCETKCNCDALGDGYKCVLNEVQVNNMGYNASGKRTVNISNVPAYIGEEVCICKEMSCEERYPNNAEAQACCVLGLEWDSTNNTCECGEGKIWNKETKKCEDKKSEQPGDDKDCIVTVSTNVKCKNGKTFSETKQYPISKEKLGELTCDNLKNKINSLDNGQYINALLDEHKQLDELINEICKTDGNSGVVSGNSGGGRSMTLAEAKDILDRFFDAAEESARVWKTESGNFNGARLASDLTAGVVLGTVGGVVSANLIKKNQIKKGYEVLHCTIGGQTVADWGDEFNTNLRR